LTLLLAIAVAAVCALTLEASANGAGGGGAAPCVVTAPGRGAIPIIAVAAVTIEAAYAPSSTEGDPPTLLSPVPAVDVTLRVWKPSRRLPLVFQAFRLQLTNVNITDFLSNEALACLFLDPAAAPADRPDIASSVTGFVQAIATFLGIPPVTRFVITSKSIRNTEPVPSHEQQVCTAIESDPATRLPRCGPNDPGGSATSIADIVLFTK